MAAAPGLLFWLLLLGPPRRVPGQPDSSLSRRFSEHKLCAEEECCMLMYRGEALEDFTGPDCRFVNFKKGDHVYVYYKLAGRSPEVWAGNVGRIFGYFPRDLIQVVHEYTKEELQLPTDETDFVCFDGGKDDFDNYNIKELLRSWEIYNSATGDFERTVEKHSQHMEKPAEESDESDHDSEPKDSNLDEKESLFSDSTEHPEVPKNHPHASGQTVNAQGEHASFDPFGELLHEKLKGPESENNKTSNSSQDEQGKVDAYKLLKKEMTLDLKTKFGSTADALVSDDETTRLVTSLEDDLDEELDGEFYTVGKEEEEDKEDFDELPLLTFSGEEDVQTPEQYRAEKYPTDQEQKSNGETVTETAQSPGIQDDGKNTRGTLEDTPFVVMGREEKTGMVGLENSNSKEQVEENARSLVIPDTKWGEQQSAGDSLDPENTEDNILIVEITKTNDDKDPKMTTELDIEGKGKLVQEPKRSLEQDETESEEMKQEETIVHGTTHNNNLKSLLAAVKGRGPLKSPFDNQENDQEEAAIHILKEVHEEKPDEHSLEPGPDSQSTHKTAEKQIHEEKMKEESRYIAPLSGDNQHNASEDSVQEVDILVSGPEPNKLSEEHQGEALKEKLTHKTPNQLRFSSPDEVTLPTELEKEVPVQGKNLSWQQEKDVAPAVNKHMNEDTGLSEEAVQKDTSDKKIVHHKAGQGTQEVGERDWADSTQSPGSHTEEAEADDDDYNSKELLEDENALSAKQSKEKGTGIQEKGTGIQDRMLDANLRALERVTLETVNPDPDIGRNKIETSMLLETEKTPKTVDKEVVTQFKKPANMEVEKEGSPSVAKKIHRLSEVSDSPHTHSPEKNHTPELGEVLPNKDSDYHKDDAPAEHIKTSRPEEKPEGEFLKEDHDDVRKFMDPEVQWAASEELEDHVDHWAAHTTVKPEHIDSEKDLPIIRSFFKAEQSLQRFQKYFDIHQLEAMFQEMSLRLKSAQQESLPYNVDKVLDKVFRASESHILSTAEKMIDTRMAENKNLEIKENDIFEEAAVLDDVQDLIYFVRYKHFTSEETRPVAVTQPPEESWEGPIEEIQLSDEDHLPPQNIEDLNEQVLEETGHLDQLETNDTVVSEVSQMPTTEKNLDPGIITTEGMPVVAKNQLERNTEEIASATPLENVVLLIYSFMSHLSKTLVATLPDDVQPGPDFYGLPWKPVLLTGFLGIVSFVIFFWRTVLAVKPRVYQVSEQQIAEKIKNIIKENAELVEKLSNYEQKIKESKKHVQETKKQNRILSDEAIKFEDKIKELQETNQFLDGKAESLRVMLESERELNVKNQDMILENKKSMEKLKDVISMNASEFSEVQIALNEAKLSEEKVKSECYRLQEENAKLKKKKEQLQLEIEDCRKSHAALSEQILSFQKSQKDLEIAMTHKDDNIDALTNFITQLNKFSCEGEDQNKGGSGSDELANGEMGGDQSERMKNQIKQMMDVSRTKTAISVVEEDLKLLQTKLSASLSTKCDLEEQVKTLEANRNSLLSTKAGLEDECKTLKQKVEILNELYQEKEMALQKKLSQEEYERQEKEQRLSATDEKAILAAEEVKTYKRRIKEMEAEIQKTECSFKNQIAAHEKKAHENWLKARAAERAIDEEKREAANLRHKLLEITQKMAMLQEEPVIVKPMPGRPNPQNHPRRGPLSQNGSFGPSPVSGGECSPPLTMEPPLRRHSTTFSTRDVPRTEFGTVEGPLPCPQWPSEASGKPSASDPGTAAVPLMNNSSRSSSPKVMDEGKVNIAAKGPPPFPGMPPMSSPMRGPPPPPIRYGPPPPPFGAFGPRPLPPPFGPPLRPPLGLREYAPGIPPGKRDLPLNPREFLPGNTTFRPFGPREYFVPAARLPPSPHGAQHYPPSPAAGDFPPSGSREEPPPAKSTSQDSSPALKQSP
ncbi:PREDICTED: melanoma inhibitory activity protein 3 [Elephantulus edwardii]|uniref:melanoma inhibitory activity protein 3 n=1 Tax=Elephantulus edwardii TaxID=28737 RepID=UPI0003F066B8|nr:PREDICTED: melanoma inhibitory activity protein 3 [Elephantulus edwardii]